MAKAVVRLSSWRAEHPYEDEEDLVEQIREALVVALASKSTGAVYEDDRELSADDREPGHGAIGRKRLEESVDAR